MTDSSNTPSSAQATSAAERDLPPLDFSGLIISYATSALISVGAAPDPETGQTHRDLPAAKHMIDVLAMLEEKTNGNLTTEEEQLLGKLIFDCRMAYVNATRNS